MAADNRAVDEREVHGEAIPATMRSSPTARRWRWLIPLLVLVIGLGGYFGARWWLYALSHVSTDDARVKGTLVTVSTEVPGRIVRIPLEEGQQVQKGDLLAQIQADEYEVQVTLRTAALEAVQSQLASAELDLELARSLAEGQIQRSDAVLDASRSQLAETEKAVTLEDHRTQANVREKEAGIEEARARLNGAKANLDKAKTDLERTHQLLRDGIVAVERRDQVAAAYELAIAQYQSAEEALNKSKALLQMAQAEGRKVQLSQDNVRTQQGKVRESRALKELAMAERQRVRVKEATVKDLQAKVKEAEAQLALARLRLAETTITSPVDGVVSQKIADAGERVQPGQPVVVVNDPQDVWISANIEETHIRKVQMGQPVAVHIDAYPQQTFQGKVSHIGAATRSEFAIIPSSSASAHFIKVTQRIPVRIEVDNTNGLLKPGMMVDVGIRVK